jgi:hypothetical protein
MSELDSQARAIIDAGREADEPTFADRRRIKHAIVAQLASGALASAAVAGGTSVGLKVGLAVLAVTAVGGGTVGLLKVRAHHAGETAHRSVLPRSEASPRPLPAPVLPAPSPALIPVERAAVDSARELKPGRPERARRQLATARDHALPGDDASDERLNVEVEVLKRAREALRLRQPMLALEVLRDYDRRFGKGTLGEERQALAVIATCLASPGQAARSRAEAFMRGAPSSPMLDRVRAACITAARDNAR